MPISQFILDASEQKRLQLRLRNKWMIRIRWYYVTILTSAVIVSTLAANLDREPITGYLLAAAMAYGFNGLLWLATLPLSQNILYFRIIAVSQIVVDLFMASWIVYVQGGLASRTTVLYAIPIMMAGILFQGWLAYIAAILSGLAYTAALLLFYFVHGDDTPLIDIPVPAVFYASVFFILAAVVSRVTATNALNIREKSYTELLALLRHQLHHPISVISALTEMLESGQSFQNLPPRDRRYIKQLKHENQRMHTMVSNLLEAGEQTKAVQMKMINLSPIVNDSAIDCATAAKRLEDLDTRYSGQHLMVLGQADQLRLVFDNIIDNAFRYSQEGSKVTIDITADILHVKVTVKDTGDVISSDKQKHLFERFTYFENDNEGHKASAIQSLGLGLYVSKLIIERHGGEIFVKSDPATGTIVTVQLKRRGS